MHAAGSFVSPACSPNEKGPGYRPGPFTRTGSRLGLVQGGCSLQFVLRRNKVSIAMPGSAARRSCCHASDSGRNESPAPDLRYICVVIGMRERVKPKRPRIMILGPCVGVLPGSIERRRPPVRCRRSISFEWIDVRTRRARTDRSATGVSSYAVFVFPFDYLLNSTLSAVVTGEFRNSFGDVDRWLHIARDKKVRGAH